MGTSDATPDVSAANRPAANPDCKICSGTGWEPVKVGSVTQSRRCVCLAASIRRIKLAAIPPHYRWARLETVEADQARHPDQAELFEAMRAKPTASFVLCGANGCGKTLAGWLLYRYAVEHDTPAVGVSCSDLVGQFRAWQFDDLRVPLIEPGDLRTEAKRFLFVDELDKARPTEFAAEVLFELFDAAYSYEQQIVVTSNTPLEGLAAHWSRNSVTVGVSIVRRLMEIENGFLVNLS